MLEVRGLVKTFGALRATDGVAFDDPLLIGPARRILEEVGLGARLGTLAANLSHGEQRQLEVAMALATQPRLLLLDEPMAGMGAEESQRMIGFLGTLKA